MSNTAFAYDEVKLQQIAQDPYWKKLLHYYRFLPLNSKKGEVDGNVEGFYLAGDSGRTDSLAELKATLEAFKNQSQVGKLKQPASCAFPERHRFLSQALGEKLPKSSPCELYDHHITSIHAQGVSLVFSTAYASNPGSMFGHTFLKISTGRKSDLLDKGISFAATVPSGEDGFFYILDGLFGGFVGQYSFLNYDEKVNEYVNSESRDLWEYDLGFTPEESLRLLNHLWELESNSWFNYYFVNKNCSYQLLTALEVVKPDWDLSSGWTWVVPAETLKRIIANAGTMKEVRYRPSQRKKMIQSLEVLTADERKVFQNLIRHRITAAEVNSPYVLTSAIQYIQFNRAESAGQDRKDLQEFWDKVLERRSELAQKQSTEPEEVTKNQAMKAAVSAYQAPPTVHPEHGHGPVRVTLSQGFAQRPLTPWLAYGELHLKPAYHDLMNDDRGYPRYSEINFPNITFRYYHKPRKFILEQLQFFGLMSLTPLTFYEKRMSWKVGLEIRNPKDLTCADCEVFHGEMGWGGSVNLFSDFGIIYALAGGYTEVGPSLKRYFRVGPMVDAGIIVNPGAPYKLRLRGLGYGDVFQQSRAPVFGSLHVDQSIAWSPHWETRLEGRKNLTWRTRGDSISDSSDVKISLSYYF